MVKLLVFDMDGTIIDSDIILYKTWQELYDLYNDHKVFDIKKISEYSGPPLDYAINDAFKDYKDKEFIRKEYRKRTKKYYDTDLTLFPNTYEVLKKIHDEHHIKFAIFTAKTLEMTKYCLDKYYLTELFDDFITCDSIFPPKPNKEGIEYLINKYKLNNDEIIMVGDTINDALVASNSNIKSIIFMMHERKDIDKVKITKKVNNYLEFYDYLLNEKLI